MSWRKASKSNQKVHRERHQPEIRKHLGLLEKKKDYKKRARNEEHKKRVLKALHRRALNKNPDEFHYHMYNSKLVDGVHVENEKKDDHTKEQLALMETQDLKYITMKRTIEARKIERLKSQLHMIDDSNALPNKHMFFIDEEEEDMKNFDLAKRLDTDPSLLDRKSNRPRLKDIKRLEELKLSSEELKKSTAQKEQMYKELAKRIEREKELSIVQQKLEIKRRLQQPRLLKPKKIRRGTKTSAPVYEFQYERKR